MDVLSLIGVILAFVAILGGNYLEGGHAGALQLDPIAAVLAPLHVVTDRTIHGRPADGHGGHRQPLHNR